MIYKYLLYKYTIENSLSSSSSVFALQLNVNSVKGKVSGRTIQCTFAATVPNSTARTTSFTIGISNGTYNSSKFAYCRYTSRHALHALSRVNWDPQNAIADNMLTSPHVVKAYQFCLLFSASMALGPVSTQLRSNTVNLANPNSTVTNLLTNTTSNAFIFRQSLTQGTH